MVAAGVVSSSEDVFGDIFAGFDWGTRNQHSQTFFDKIPFTNAANIPAKHTQDEHKTVSNEQKPNPFSLVLLSLIFAITEIISPGLFDLPFKFQFFS